MTLLVEHYLGDRAMLLRTESIAKHQHGSYCQFISDHIGALKISSKSFEMPKTQWSVEFNLLFLIIFQLLFVCLQLKSRCTTLVMSGLYYPAYHADQLDLSLNGIVRTKMISKMILANVQTRKH